jgi:hypothetical protein
MTVKSQSVRSALQRHLSGLAPDHERIIDAMATAGLINDGDSVRAAADAHIQTLSAAEANRSTYHLARQAINMLRHAQIDIDVGSVISGDDLSAKMRAKNMSIEERLRIKTALHQIGCLS